MPQVAKKKQEAQKRTSPRSAILHYLHAFTAFLYGYISKSLIGKLVDLYGYLQQCYENGRVSTVLRSRRKRHDRFFFRLRLALAAMIEQSAMSRGCARLRRTLMRCSLNTYGIFSFFFGCFAVVTYLMSVYFGDTAPISHLATGVFMIVLALPLFVSDKPLCRVLGESYVLRCLLVNVCGIPTENFDAAPGQNGENREGEEHYFLALVLAVVAGLACAALSIAPYVIPVLMMLLLAIQTVLLYPEIGLLCIAFFTPLLTLIDGVRPTAVLLCLMGVTMLSFILKLIGGKRVFRLELIDGAVLLLGVLYLLGGLVTRGGVASLRSGLTYTAFLCCYFLAASLIRSREWVRRMVGALSISCVLVAVLGVLQYFLSDLGARYLDLSLFADLGGRVFSTMQNPNMLAEYLILLLPLLFALLAMPGRPLRSFGMLLVTGVVVCCLILTWSRGAWLGALVGWLLLLLLMGHRSLSYLLLSALPVAAGLHYLPEKMLRRFGSIGSAADSSIRYRVYLWDGVGNMLRDHWFAGVGVGESAFCEVYSQYALPGIATAMHSHNLYLQLLCELGVSGLAVFVTVMVLFICYALSYVTGRGDRAGRMTVLGLLCGIISLLLMGMTDHIFYNYRIFLLFWLVVGIAVAQIRIGRAEAARETPYHPFAGAGSIAWF